MLNPINGKLRKMACRSKKPALTPLRDITRRFHTRPNKQNESCHSNDSFRSSKNYETAISFLKQPSKQLRPTSAEMKLEECLKDNENLKEMIKTHEMMEEFYLKQLQLQKKEKKDLQWRLSILSEQIQHSTQPKNKARRTNPLLTQKILKARNAMTERWTEQ